MQAFYYDAPAAADPPRQPAEQPLRLPGRGGPAASGGRGEGGDARHQTHNDAKELAGGDRASGRPVAPVGGDGPPPEGGHHLQQSADRRPDHPRLDGGGHQSTEVTLTWKDQKHVLEMAPVAAGTSTLRRERR